MKTYDVVGVGFGPANLSLAIAARENMPSLQTLFLEKSAEFAWHPGMLLQGSDMQVSFLKDLVTIRNPRSEFTYLQYLRTVGRLLDFINLREFFPARTEFADYLKWAASHFAGSVQYNAEVTELIPENSDIEGAVLITYWDSVKEQKCMVRARNVVIGVGGKPKLLSVHGASTASNRIWHSSGYLRNWAGSVLDPREIHRVAVVGGGQSAAEIVLDLHSRLPMAKIDSYFRGYALRPADDSEFVNELFHPEFVDAFHAMPDEERKKFISQHMNTNYSVVDRDLIRRLYRIAYNEKCQSTPRLQLCSMSEVTNMEAADSTVYLRSQSVNRAAEVQDASYDLVILATGYDFRAPVTALLDGVHKSLPSDGGAWSVDRCYRLRTASGVRANIYIQSGNEKTHGLSDSLLSILPARSEIILNELRSDAGRAENRSEDHHGDARDMCETLAS